MIKKSRGYGTVTEDGYPKHDLREAEHPKRRGAFSAKGGLSANRKIPSRNGEDGKTQIGKVPGDDEGPPQADRDGTRAGMPAGSGASEGEGGAAVTCHRSRAQAKQARPGWVIPGGTPPRALSGGAG